MYSCDKALQNIFMGLTALGLVGGLLGNIVFQGFALFYGIHGVKSGHDSCDSNAAFNWVWFICITSGLSCWATLVQGKTVFDSAGDDGSHFPALIGIIFVWGLCVGFTSMLHFMPECRGDAREAIFVYGVGSLATSAAILFTIGMGSCSDYFSRRLAHKQESPPPVPATMATPADLEDGMSPY